jgi:ABC-type nitrate/sulfonate/bicarbonate transport system substrate-binding protein
MMREYCQDAGLEENVDYQLINLDWPAKLPALLNGEVDATVLGGEETAQALDAGFKVLFMMCDEFPDFAQMGLVATDNIIAARPEVVQGMVKALYRSTIHLMENREDALDYAVNELGLDQEDADFAYDFGYEGIYGTNPIRITPDLPDTMLQWSMAFWARTLDIPEVPLTQIADEQFIDAVKAEL